FKQEKRSVKKERAAAIEKRFEEKRQAKSGVISREAADSLKNKVVRTEPKPVQPAAKTQQITQPGAQNKPVEKKTTRGPKPGSLEEKKLAAAINAPQNNHQVSKPVANKAGLTTGGSRLKTDLMPLNKYVAHSGVCSRRDAADLIRAGEVKVNDAVVTEPGTKVSAKDTITIKGKKLVPSKNLVYILLNKPKDYITTLDDPEGRKTVLDLI